MIAALRRRRWSLAWLLAIVATGVVLGWLVTVPLLRGEPDGRDGARVGQSAPPLELDDLDSRRWSLTGTDAPLVWVNFWAVSCEPCRKEMPAMQLLAEAHPDELVILGVNWGEERGGVVDYVERLGIEYPILLDPGLETFYRWAGTDGLPRHYFIGAESTILREIVGPLDPSRMVDIVEALLSSS